MQTRISEKKLLFRIGQDLHQARTNPPGDDVLPGCDVTQQVPFQPTQAISGTFYPVFNSFLMELPNLLLREFLRREDVSIANTEPLNPKRSDHFLAKLSRAHGSTGSFELYFSWA
jgi:hypothetical protein